MSRSASRATRLRRRRSGTAPTTASRDRDRRVPRHVAGGTPDTDRRRSPWRTANTSTRWSRARANSTTRDEQSNELCLVDQSPAMPRDRRSISSMQVAVGIGRASDPCCHHRRSRYVSASSSPPCADDRFDEAIGVVYAKRQVCEARARSSPRGACSPTGAGCGVPEQFEAKAVALRGRPDPAPARERRAAAPTRRRRTSCRPTSANPSAVQ